VKLTEKVNEARSQLFKKETFFSDKGLPLPLVNVYKPVVESENSGLNFFGLTKDWILKLIESNPEAIRCYGYQFKTIPLTQTKIQEILAKEKQQEALQKEIEKILNTENPSGSARTEIYTPKRKRLSSSNARTHHYSVATSSSLLIPSINTPANAPQQQQLKQSSDVHSFTNLLPDAMKYRLSKVNSRHLRFG
jgi:hypothetical protein